MSQEQQILFGPFRFDTVNEQLWRDEQEVKLRPKSLAVLHYIAEHPGRLVTKAELMQNVWAGTYVTPTVLRVCVREIRVALGDEAAAPRFLETAGRLGYRFIAPLPTSPRVARHESPALDPPRHPTLPVVGREAEVARLCRWLEKAVQDERQIIFVTGEPGIGKTTIVDLFLERVQTTAQVRIGRGQCLEQYGAGEAYLPVLEAFGQLCREPGGDRLMELLSQYAPTWLVQMPALVGEAALETLQRKVAGATRERMLREMAEAIEALTAERGLGLVLVIEDLQWSDPSTLELIAYVAQRRQRAQLLVIGTYRPTDVIVSGHPLKGIKQELQAHGQCEELRLELLTEGAVAEYVVGRLSGEAQPAAPLQELSRLIHRRTDGNALFMVNIVEHLVREGLVREGDGRWELQDHLEKIGVPESLRQLIERQVEKLGEEEQHVLEVASVAGTEFAVVAVAAGIKGEGEEVEEICEDLAWKGHFLQESGLAEWPDGTVSGRYRFRHALYQNVLSERMGAARRARVHRWIGERLARGYGDRAREIAAELAVHFEQGRDYVRAVPYRQQAGENALHRSAHVEAIEHLTKGLARLTTLPETPECAQQELALQIALSTSLIATKGYAAPEVENACTRARELCQQIGETPKLFSVLGGLCSVYYNRAELQTAFALAEQMLHLAENVQDPRLLVWAHYALASSLVGQGELRSARSHLEKSIALYDPQPSGSSGWVHDPGVACRADVAYVLWLLGYPDQALKSGQEALSQARDLSHPYNLAWALNYTAELHRLGSEDQATQELAEAAIALSQEHGFAQLVAESSFTQGCMLAERGQAAKGMRQMQQGLATFQATGAESGQSARLALLAEAYGREGQAEEGLGLLSEAVALVNKTGERFYEAEVYRLKGELILNDERGTRNDERRKKTTTLPSVHHSSFIIHRFAEAETCFHKAIEIARRQEAKSWELRTVMSLSRLWQQQGKKKAARKRLTEIYGWFTEGFDTTDLKAAKVLLEELS